MLLFSLLLSNVVNAAQVSPLFEARAHVVGSLLAFKLSGLDAGDIRDLKIEGASFEECRVTRDPFYADILQLKCVVKKQGLRLRLTFSSGGQTDTIYSDPFDVQPVQDGFIEIKPASVLGGP